MNEEDFGEPRLQVRCQYDNNRIHIQGVGEPIVNRKYGIALELRAPTDLTEWLNDQTPTNKSPASGSLLYIPLQMYHYIEHDDVVQFLIKGTELNHPSGAMLDVSMESPAVETVVAFIKDTSSGIVIEAGEVFTTGDEEE